MKRLFILFLSTALCLSVGGCAALPYAHEIEKTVLMGVLGVDVSEETPDGVAVTAASGARAGAGDSPGQAPVILAAQAQTVASACAVMQSFGSEYIFFGDVEQVLVGEGETVRGLEPLLSHMARDPELRLEAQLWVVKGGSAADALFAVSEGGGAPDRLAALERDAELISAPRPFTARETLVDLLDNGCTLLPALEQRKAEPGEGAEGETVLAAAGYAILRDGALCGWTGETAAFGADLLAGLGQGRMLELDTPELVRAALKLTGVKTYLKPVFEGDRLVGLSVSCTIEAQAVEVQGAGGSLGESARTWLEEKLGGVAETGLRAALDQFQALGADCLHLGRKAALAVPWRKETLKTQWEGAFPKLDISLEVKASIERG